MPAAVLVEILITTVGELVMHLGAQAISAKWKDNSAAKALEGLEPDQRRDAAQAFITGLFFVAAHDGKLSPGELKEIQRRTERLDIEETGADIAIAEAARREVAESMDMAPGDFAATIMARLPSEDLEEALLRLSVNVALRGGIDGHREAIELLANAAGWDDARLDALIKKQMSLMVR